MAIPCHRCPSNSRWDDPFMNRNQTGGDRRDVLIQIKSTPEPNPCNKAMWNIIWTHGVSCSFVPFVCSSSVSCDGTIVWDALAELTSAVGLVARDDWLHDCLIYVISIPPNVSSSCQFSRQMDRRNFGEDNCSVLKRCNDKLLGHEVHRLIKPPDVESHARDQRIRLDNGELSATRDSRNR